ncbi:hypothetical protein NC652_021761 [Populus alba x Populus x berolinensis]|nr:hypothetical protein NC652_021761 [Populus alba x Populus x berolinensis]
MVSRRKGDGTSKHSNVSFKGIQKHVLYWISESRKELMLRKQQKLFIHAGLPIGYVTIHHGQQSFLTIFLLLLGEFQDPTRNPAVEEQAIMRIHWIGQKHTVSDRRFIVKVRFFS